jgi:hypothetical protein
VLFSCIAAFVAGDRNGCRTLKLVVATLWPHKSRHSGVSWSVRAGARTKKRSSAA